MIYPMFAMVVLTAVVLVTLFRSRVAAVRQGRIALADIPVHQSEHYSATWRNGRWRLKATVAGGCRARKVLAVLLGGGQAHRRSSKSDAQREEVLTTVSRSDPCVRPVANAQLERTAGLAEIEARREEVGEIPVGGLEVVELRPVVGAESQIELAQPPVQHPPASHGGEPPVGIGCMVARRHAANWDSLRSRKTIGTEFPAAVIQLERPLQHHAIGPVEVAECCAAAN